MVALPTFEGLCDQFLDFIGGKPPWYRDWLRHVADTQQAAFLGGMRIGG